MPQPTLFTPLQIRALTLRNRVMVAPMLQYTAIKGFATDWHVMNAGRYAAGGAALVFVESTKIERRGCGTLGDLGLWDDAFVPGLTRICELVHGMGAAIGIQLAHSGRKSRVHRPWEGGKPLARTPEIEDWDAWELVAPSAIAYDAATPTPRELTAVEVRSIVEEWGRAAARAHRAGFDVVEIHGAHGLLLHQFLSPSANHRTDVYGGTREKRMRFAIEVCEAVRANWPAEKPLFLRLSCEDDAGWGPEDCVALARLVKPLGVDVIDCSAGGLISKPPALKSAYGYQVPYAEKIRREAGIMTVAVGLIVHAAQAEQIIARGQADLVALAREMLYNPNWTMDAALKLGAHAPYDLTPPPYGWWLARRAATVRDIKPSTFGPGQP